MRLWSFAKRGSDGAKTAPAPLPDARRCYDQNPEPFALLTLTGDAMRVEYANAAFRSIAGTDKLDELMNAGDATVLVAMRRVCRGESAKDARLRADLTARFFPIDDRHCGCSLSVASSRSLLDNDKASIFRVFPYMPRALLAVLRAGDAVYEYQSAADSLYEFLYDELGFEYRLVLPNARGALAGYLEQYLAPDDRECALRFLRGAFAGETLCRSELFRRWDADTCAYRWSVYETMPEEGRLYVWVRDAHDVKEKSIAYADSLVREIEETRATLALREKETMSDYNAMNDLMCSLVEYRSLESGGHVHRIKALTNALLKAARDLGAEPGLDEETIECITNASVLHDVGKIGIDDTVLRKPGRLTGSEFALMKLHTVFGADIVNRMPFVRLQQRTAAYAYDICRHHHERYDGKGYPDALTGEKIPFAAQIVSVADVYDALVTERVYKKAFPPDEAYHMIVRGECGAFSDRLLRCLEAAKSEFERISQMQLHDGAIPLSMAQHVIGTLPEA